MALAFTSVVPGADSVGNRRQTVTDVILDNNYTTGGYVLTPGQLGLSRVDYGDVGLKTVVAAGPASGFLDCTNPYAPKLKLNAAGAEITASAALSLATLEITAVGEI